MQIYIFQMFICLETFYDFFFRDVKNDVRLNANVIFQDGGGMLENNLFSLTSRETLEILSVLHRIDDPNSQPEIQMNFPPTVTDGKNKEFMIEKRNYRASSDVLQSDTEDEDSNLEYLNANVDRDSEKGYSFLKASNDNLSIQVIIIKFTFI